METLSPACEECGHSTILCSYCGHPEDQHIQGGCTVDDCDCGYLAPNQTGEHVIVDRDQVTGAVELAWWCGECRDERERHEEQAKRLWEMSR